MNLNPGLNFCLVGGTITYKHLPNCNVEVTSEGIEPLYLLEVMFDTVIHSGYEYVTTVYGDSECLWFIGNKPHEYA